VVEKEDFSYCMPEFIGLCDPIAAIWRIHEMENIFKAIKWANEDKKFRPPLKMLVPIWKALCAATNCKESFDQFRKIGSLLVYYAKRSM
ncbi:hypothetical protein Tco_1251321, partial [Tanacetum coccineum]